VIGAAALIAALTALAAGARIYRVRSAVASVERLGGFVSTSTHGAHPLRRLFGPEHLGIADGPTVVVLNDTGISDAELRTLIADLRQFDRVFGIKLADATISDEGLGMLTEFTELRVLDLSNTEITDTGLERLPQPSNLQQLTLDGTQITGTGLVHLVQLGRLERLSLDGTEVDDAGMQPLAKLALPALNVTDD
jgi:hypothetical protein